MVLHRMIASEQGITDLRTCGYSTEIHLLMDGMGNPWAFTITGGQAHETISFLDVLDKADKDLYDNDHPAMKCIPKEGDRSAKD